MGKGIGSRSTGGRDIGKGRLSKKFTRKKKVQKKKKAQEPVQATAPGAGQEQ